MIGNELKDIANILRRDVLLMTTAAGSGHPSSCLSCAEIMSVLFFSEMAYETHDAHNLDNDEFVLSKGHAAPILYSALFRAGCVKKDLLTLRKFGSIYEGHPMPQVFPWAKVATGSLGQGLSVGVGMAFAARMQGRHYRTYVLMGDSETAEGSVYEAMALASYHKLDNLCVIVDVNRLGQSRETMLGHDIAAYERRFASFGAEVISIDGHDVSEVGNALAKARGVHGRPTVILAKTFKGHGVSFIENKEGWHGKTLDKDQLEKALKEIPERRMPKIEIQRPKKTQVKYKQSKVPIAVSYSPKDLVATREAYGSALAKLAAADDHVVAVDAEVSNSTHSGDFAKVRPDRYVESFIAEQAMIGLALGLSVKGMNVYASTFAAFLSRAHDQIRMAALSGAHFTVCGSHAGVSIGEDGPSQMGLEDIAMFRALPGSVVFYPSDAVSTEKLVELAGKIEGIRYIRTGRPKTAVIYDNKEKFELGGYKILRESKKDHLMIIAAGITLHESLKAYEDLKKHGILARIIDLYCVKPLNARHLAKEAKKSGSRVLVVEDHYTEGGIGEAVFSALSNEEKEIKFDHLAVRKISCSGKAEELLRHHGIDAETIVKSARKLAKR